MATDLIKEIRPDIEMDVWGNAYNREEDFRDHNVFILGYSHYSLITLPSREKLSIGQYKEIEKIILNIKEYNENNPYNTWELFVDAPAAANIKGGNYEKREEELLISLEKYITDDYIKTDKNIIGKAISENKTL